MYVEPSASSETKVAHELEDEAEVGLVDLELSAEDHVLLAEHLEQRPSVGLLEERDPEVVGEPDVVAVERGPLDEPDRLDRVRVRRREPKPSTTGSRTLISVLAGWCLGKREVDLGAESVDEPSD